MVGDRAAAIHFPDNLSLACPLNASNKLMKAASHVPKVYVVKVAVTPNESGLEKLRRGLSIPAERRFVSKRRRSSSDQTENTDRAESSENESRTDGARNISKSRNAK